MDEEPHQAQARHKFWHPVDDGLTPIVEALDKCVGAQPDKSKKKNTGHIQSAVLAEALTEKIPGPNGQQVGRWELTRAWLRANGFEEEAISQDESFEDLLKLLRDLEKTPRPSKRTIATARAWVGGDAEGIEDLAKHVSAAVDWMILPDVRAKAGNISANDQGPDLTKIEELLRQDIRERRRTEFHPNSLAEWLYQRPVTKAEQAKLYGTSHQAATGAEEPTLTSNPESPTGHNGNPDDESMLSPTALARIFGLPKEKVDAFKKSMERHCRKDADFVAVADRKPRDPEFLYRLGAARPWAEKLKAKVSRQRPAK